MHLDSSVAGQLLNCCHGGRLCALHDDPLLQKFQLQPMSASMSTIMVDGIKTFGQLSSTYNNIVALCATGVKNDHGGGFERRVGNHAVTLNGRTYHYVPRAEAGTRPSGGMSYFVFDHTAAEAIRMHVLNRIPRTQQHADVVANDHIIVDANGPPVIPLPASNVVQNNSSIPLLNTDIAMALRNELLAINPYCKELQFVGSIINEMDARQAPISAEVVNASLRNAVQYFDVAHLTEDRATGERVVRFNTVAGRNGEVDMDSLHVEPMTYPLLFMHGERGWSKQDESDIPYNRYLSSRLLMPELKSFRADPYTAGLHFLTVEHATDFVEIVSTYTFFKSLILYSIKLIMSLSIWQDNDQFRKELRVNRFQVCARLSQVYIVDMVSRSIDRKLNFINRNQESLLMGKKRGSGRRTKEGSDSELSSDDEDPNKNVFLPSSFHGSPRHRKNLALNSLHIVNVVGPTTLFMTGTTNTNWPEIRSQLLPGQTAFDRPDVVTQVFQARLKKFIFNLKNGANCFTEFYYNILNVLTLLSM
jgi:hypothetical protein